MRKQLFGSGGGRSAATALIAIALWSGQLGCRSTAPTAGEATPREATLALIVQGTDLGAVKEAVLAVGGKISHELAIIRAVGAELTATQE